MSYITRFLSTMSRFGMRSLNRLFSHFFWFNPSAFRLASPPGGMHLPPEGEPCILLYVLLFQLFGEYGYKANLRRLSLRTGRFITGPRLCTKLMFWLEDVRGSLQVDSLQVTIKTNLLAELNLQSRAGFQVSL